MIHLSTHTSYKYLYKNLVQVVLQPSENTFAETWIVVPNHSAKQWLQKALANDLGVCAQIKFILPLSFNWEILQNVSQSKHKINVFSADVLRWKIYHCLKEMQEFKFLNSGSDLSQFKLSEKIAQTLLKYNEERPEMIHDWDNGTFHLEKEQEWQANLWLHLLEELNEKSHAQLLEQFDPATDFLQQPNAIVLFGTEQLSSIQHLSLLKLAQKQDIHVMLSNPCPEFYWYDLREMKSITRQAMLDTQAAGLLEVGHPLLASMGRNKMAIFDAFLEDSHLQEQQEVCINETPQSLLQSVQSDVIQLRENPEFFEVDSSIKIHACHNRKREVEIIKDEILSSLAKDTQLYPEQIIVVAPDINDYVDAIRSVFEHHEKNQGSIYLPFHIDRVRLADAQYITSMMALLHGFSEEMTATHLYDLLSLPIVFEAFNMSEDDMPRIKNWVRSSNIRNYYSAQHKSDLGFEAKIGNTWKFGEYRWISGHLTGAVNDTEYRSTFGDFSGQEQLFSQCFKFVDLWHQTQQLFQQPESPQVWFTRLQKMCQGFLFNDNNDDYESKIFKQLENKLIQQPLSSGDKVPLAVIVDIVEAVVTENNYRSEGQIGVRFQTWENAFVVDAKLLIALGVNDTEFPHPDIKNDLDVFNNSPAKLNKSTRQRDKNLMLTAITENSEKIILTYIGFNAKTNDPQPPSVLLTEFINYLTTKTHGDFKVIENKMHGFNRFYFDASSPAMRSYNHQNYDLAQCFYTPIQAPEQAAICLNTQPEKVLEINQFGAFFSDPMDYFLKNQASIQNGIYDDGLLDLETYRPTGLEKWQLNHMIYDEGLEVAEKTGIISDNKLGQQVLDQSAHELTHLLGLKSDLKRINHQIVVEDCLVLGTLTINENNQLVSIYPSKSNSKKISEHWIRHLFYNSDLPSIVYFIDKTIVFKAIDDQSLLPLILKKWEESHVKPWLFCTHKLFHSNNKSGLAQCTLKSYLQSFEESKNSFPSEGQKYFKNHCFDGALIADIENDIEIFVQPIVNHSEAMK